MVSEQAAGPSMVRRKSKRNMRPAIAVVVLAALAGGGWWGWTKSHPADDGNSKLLTDTIKRGDLVEAVSASGSVTAQTGAQVKIGSQITGRIKRLYADVGSKVKAGQTIAELDLPDIEAQLRQAEATRAAAESRLRQQQSGVGMQQTQTSGAVAQARADLNSARAQLQSALAAANLQGAQTPNDIKRASSAVAGAEAGLATANSNLRQVNASANLQISNAQEQVKQAQATARNTAVTLKRNQSLLAQGFVAASVVDAAQATDAVAQSQVQSASQNVNLMREKVTADRQAAQDQVAQAQETLNSARAAQESAQAGTFQVKVKQADVTNARSRIAQMEAALRMAQGNTTQDVLKLQDVQQARDAVRQAQAQVDYNRAQLAKTVIRSPISGTVLQLASQQGETLAAGLSAPTLIIVADLTRLQVDAFVDETDIGKIHVGQQADVTVDAFSKRAFKGHVAKVASGSTIQQGVITYDVTIALDGVKRPGSGPGGHAGGKDVGQGSGRGGAATEADGAGGARPAGNPMQMLKPDMTRA